MIFLLLERGFESKNHWHGRLASLRSYLKLEQLGNSILMNTGTVSKADSTLFHRSPSAAGGSHGPYGLSFFD